MGILWALSIRKWLPPRSCCEMAAHSVQRARHKGETYRFPSDLRQSRIHHAHADSEHRDFDKDHPMAMQFKNSNGCKQARNHKKNRAVGVTRSGLTKEGSQKSTGDERQDGYCGGQGSMEIPLSTLQAGCSRVSAHERHGSSQERKSISIHIASDQGEEH